MSDSTAAQDIKTAIQYAHWTLGQLYKALANQADQHPEAAYVVFDLTRPAPTCFSQPSCLSLKDALDRFHGTNHQNCSPKKKVKKTYAAIGEGFCETFNKFEDAAVFIQHFGNGAIYEWLSDANSPRGR